MNIMLETSVLLLRVAARGLATNVAMVLKYIYYELDAHALLCTMWFSQLTLTQETSFAQQMTLPMQTFETQCSWRILCIGNEQCCPEFTPSFQSGNSGGKNLVVT